MNNYRILRYKEKTEFLINLFKQKGYLNTQEIEEVGIAKKHITEITKKYPIERLKRGLYEYSEYDFESLMEKAANIAPKGVFCLVSAFNYYGLSTDIVPNFQMAVPRGYKTTIPDSFSEIDFIYLIPENYNLGITEVKIGGNIVKIYDREKCVCDAVKFRNKIVEDITHEVLYNYFKDSEKINYSKLMEYAKITGTEKYIKEWEKNK